MNLLKELNVDRTTIVMVTHSEENAQAVRLSNTTSFSPNLPAKQHQ
jgi:ABC-type phosphate transport system ATPase subunit